MPHWYAACLKSLVSRQALEMLIALRAGYSGVAPAIVCPSGLASDRVVEVVIQYVAAAEMAVRTYLTTS
jgi:hypothetical protein